MKRILIISRIFAPCASVGGHRAVKLARSISDYGWDPIVLTAPPRCQELIDPAFAEDVLERCRIETVPCYSLWQHSQDWKKSSSPVRRTVLRAGRVLERLSRKINPFDCADWWMKAAVGKGVNLVKRLRIDLIWATSPLLSALVLAREIGLRTHTPYIVDFRDVTSLAKNPTGGARRLLQIERTVVRDAAAVSYVSPAQWEALVGRSAELKTKTCRLIYNWFEAGEAERYPPRQFDQPTILHGGVLYGGQRRLEAFLQAMAMLRDTSLGEIRFVQHSIEDDLSYLKADCRRIGIENAVSIGGVLRRPEFMSACQGSDILLLAIGHDSNGSQHAGAIPGKLYDYLAACRPILVVGPAGSEAGRIVEMLQRGIAVSDDRPDEIADAIKLLLNRQGRQGPLRLDLASAGQFESAGAMRALAGLFDAVLSAHRSKREFVSAPA